MSHCKPPPLQAPALSEAELEVGARAPARPPRSLPASLGAAPGERPAEGTERAQGQGRACRAVLASPGPPRGLRDTGGRVWGNESQRARQTAPSTENSAGAEPPRSPLRPRPTSGAALEPARNPGAGGPGGLSRSSPQFGGLTAPVRVFPRVSRPQGAAPKRARHSRGESLAPRTRGPVFEIPGRRPGALGYRTHPPTPHAGSSRTDSPVALPRSSRRPGPGFRAPSPASGPPRFALPATPERD